MSDTPQPPMPQPSAEEPTSAQIVAHHQKPSDSSMVSRDQQISTLSDAAVKAAVSASLPFEASMQQQQMQWNLVDNFSSDQAKLRALHGGASAGYNTTPVAGSFSAPFGATTVYGGSQPIIYGGQNGPSYTHHQMYSQGPTQYQSSGIRQISAVGSLLGQQSSTTTSRVDMSGQRIIGERVIEHEVKVPKKVVREDVVEKVIVIPEKIVHEEVIEDVQKIREKIIEVAVPVIQERIVEVPEIEYIEKIVEVPEIIYQEKVREIPRIEIQERIIEIPRIVHQEKIVEIPEIEYRDIPVEKIVEVPEIREQIVVKEIPVPQYIDKPIPQYVDVHQEQEISRAIPIPVEAVTTCEFKLPRIRPRYTKVDVPLYVPRFVEVPIPLDVMDTQAAAQAESYAQQVAALAAQSAVSMCEVENLAGSIKATNFEHVIGQQNHSEAIAQHWMSGRLQVDPMSMAYAASSSTPPVLESLANQQQTTTTTTTTTSSSMMTTSTMGNTLHQSSNLINNRDVPAAGPSAVLSYAELPVLPTQMEAAVHLEGVPREITTSSRHIGTTETTSTLVVTSTPVNVTNSPSASPRAGAAEQATTAATAESFVANPPVVTTTTTEFHREASSSVEVEVTETKTTTTIINPDGTEAIEVAAMTQNTEKPPAQD